jgi:hypothetical protein
MSTSTKAPDRSIETTARDANTKAAAIDTLKLDAQGKTPNGELSEREAASRMAKNLKSRLKIADRRVGGFEHRS